MSGIPREILRWLQTLDLTYPVNQPKRDLANGFTIAEICSRYWQNVPLHSFINKLSAANKESNWFILRKVFKENDFFLSVVSPFTHASPSAMAALRRAMTKEERDFDDLLLGTMRAENLPNSSPLRPVVAIPEDAQEVPPVSCALVLLHLLYTALTHRVIQHAPPLRDAPVVEKVPQFVKKALTGPEAYQSQKPTMLSQNDIRAREDETFRKEQEWQQQQREKLEKQQQAQAQGKERVKQITQRSQQLSKRAPEAIKPGSGQATDPAADVQFEAVTVKALPATLLARFSGGSGLAGGVAGVAQNAKNDKAHAADDRSSERCIFTFLSGIIEEILGDELSGTGGGWNNSGSDDNNTSSSSAQWTLDTESPTMFHFLVRRTAHPEGGNTTNTNSNGNKNIYNSSGTQQSSPQRSHGVLTLVWERLLLRLSDIATFLVTYPHQLAVLVQTLLRIGNQASPGQGNNHNNSNNNNKNNNNNENAKNINNVNGDNSSNESSSAGLSNGLLTDLSSIVRTYDSLNAPSSHTAQLLLLPVLHAIRCSDGKILTLLESVGGEDDDNNENHATAPRLPQQPGATAVVDQQQQQQQQQQQTSTCSSWRSTLTASMLRTVVKAYPQHVFLAALVCQLRLCAVSSSQSQRGGIRHYDLRLLELFRLFVAPAIVFNCGNNPWTHSQCAAVAWIATLFIPPSDVAVPVSVTVAAPTDNHQQDSAEQSVDATSTEGTEHSTATASTASVHRVAPPSHFVLAVLSILRGLLCNNESDAVNAMQQYVAVTRLVVEMTIHAYNYQLVTTGLQGAPDITKPSISSSSSLVFQFPVPLQGALTYIATSVLETAPAGSTLASTALRLLPLLAEHSDLPMQQSPLGDAATPQEYLAGTVAKLLRGAAAVASGTTISSSEALPPCSIPAWLAVLDLLYAVVVGCRRRGVERLTQCNGVVAAAADALLEALCTKEFLLPLQGKNPPRAPVVVRQYAAFIIAKMHLNTEGEQAETKAVVYSVLANTDVQNPTLHLLGVSSNSNDKSPVENNINNSAAQPCYKGTISHPYYISRCTKRLPLASLHSEKDAASALLAYQNQQDMSALLYLAQGMHRYIVETVGAPNIAALTSPITYQQYARGDASVLPKATPAIVAAAHRLLVPIEVQQQQQRPRKLGALLRALSTTESCATGGSLLPPSLASAATRPSSEEELNNTGDATSAWWDLLRVLSPHILFFLHAAHYDSSIGGAKGTSSGAAGPQLKHYAALATQLATQLYIDHSGQYHPTETGMLSDAVAQRAVAWISATVGATA